MTIFGRIRAWESEAKLKLVRWMNRAALGVTGLATFAWDKFPDAVKNAALHAPWWAALAGVGLFCVVIEHATAKPKNAA